MRDRIVPLGTSLLRMVFRPMNAPQVVVTSDWPEDAEVINMIWDFNTRTAKLLVRSETFDDVPAGGVPPEWRPTFFARDIPASLMLLFERMDVEARNARA